MDDRATAGRRRLLATQLEEAIAAHDAARRRQVRLQWLIDRVERRCDRICTEGRPQADLILAQQRRKRLRRAHDAACEAIGAARWTRDRIVAQVAAVLRGAGRVPEHVEVHVDQRSEVLA